MFNSQEVLPNTLFWGIASALIDTSTLLPHSVKYYLYSDPQVDIDLKNYIDSLSDGIVIGLSICGDGVQSVLGFQPGTPVRESIKSIGSYYIDSISYRDSWAIIGRKGAIAGSVQESYKKQFYGTATIDTSKEILTSVDEVDNINPKNFNLFQNYPNPFNPSTNIKFEIKEEGNISIRIFNILGKEIKLLINDKLPTGEYTIQWGGKDNEGNLLTGGVYFIQMETGKDRQTIKATLLK
jgi:hypothetical protein